MPAGRLSAVALLACWASAQSQPASTSQPLAASARLTEWARDFCNIDPDRREQAWRGLSAAGAAAVPALTGLLVRTWPNDPSQILTPPEPVALPDLGAIAAGAHVSAARLLALLFADAFDACAVGAELAKWPAPPITEPPGRAAEPALGAALLLAQLGRAAAPAAPQLVALLEEPSMEVAAQVCRTLEQIGAPALPPLLERQRAFAADDERAAVAVVVHALGRLAPQRPTEVAPVLLPLLQDARHAVRVCAFHGLVRCGRVAVPELMAALCKEDDEPLSFHALGVLCRTLRGAELVSALRAALHHRLALIRDYGMVAAGHLLVTGAIVGSGAAELRTELLGWKPGLEWRAGGGRLRSWLLALSACGSEAAVALPAVRAVLADGDPASRRAALLLLVHIGSAATDATPGLLALLQDPAAGLVTEVVDALVTIHPPAAHAAAIDTALAAAWQCAGNQDDRTAVLAGLATFGAQSRATQAVVAAALAGSDFDLRVLGTLAQLRVGGAAADALVQELIGDLRAGWSADRRFAARVLGLAAAATAMEPLAAALAVETHVPTWASMVQALEGLRAASRPASAPAGGDGPSGQAATK